jgi:hypothetical protein
MQLDQYFRSQTPRGGAGNVITNLPNSHAEGERLGNMITDLGFTAAKQIEDAQYRSDLSSAQRQMNEQYLEFYNSLDPNDTENWQKNLETFQEKYEAIKVRSSRARSELPGLIADAKLSQKKSIMGYQMQVDSRNLQREYQLNLRSTIETAAKQASPQEFQAVIQPYLKQTLGFEPEDPEQPITLNDKNELVNIESIEGWHDPRFVNENVRRAEAKSIIYHAQLAYESEQIKKQYKEASTYVQAEANTEAALKDINEAIDKGGRWDLFPDLDTGELRTIRNIATAEKSRREQEKKTLNETLSNDIRNKIQQRVPLSDVLDMITQQPGLDPDEKNELAKYAHETANLFGGKRADENDSNALAKAYQIVASDMTQDQKFRNLMSLKTKLKSTTVDGFIEDIYKPETVSNETYKQYSAAITALKTGKMFSTEVTENINLTVKAQNLLRKFAEQNPDATADDYAKFFNRLIENQTSAWAILPGGKSFWNSLRREKGELRYSIPRNIATLERELGQTETGGLSSLSDEELLKRIMGK